MATIAEIRAQYPQYADMPDAALADALHSKFYSDIPRADFDAKIGLAAAPATAAPEGMPGARQKQRAPTGYFIDSQTGQLREQTDLERLVTGDKKISTGQRVYQAVRP